MEQHESWMHKIRSLAPTIESTEYEVYKCEAEVKKLQAQLKLQALGEGIKTTSAQETYAEASEELYKAQAESSKNDDTSTGNAKANKKEGEDDVQDVDFEEVK